MTLEQLRLPSPRATGLKAAGRRGPVNPTNSTNAANFSISGSHNSFIYKHFEIVILSPFLAPARGLETVWAWPRGPESDVGWCHRRRHSGAVFTAGSLRAARSRLSAILF